MKRGKASDDKRREKVDKRRESVERWKRRRMTGVKMKVLCTTRIVRKQRDVNIVVENIESEVNLSCVWQEMLGLWNYESFCSHCMAKANVNVVERGSGSADEYCHTLESLGESEILHVHSASDHEYARKLFVTISLGNSMVKFQLDSGATCNLLRTKYLEDGNELTLTRKWLTMYNDTMIKPLGMCTMEVLNPKNSRSYHVEFVVVDSDRAILILGNQTMQQMNLIRVQQHNVMSVNTSQACFTAEQLLKDYPDVFKGTGKLEGQYKLEVEDGATPVVH